MVYINVNGEKGGSMQSTGIILAGGKSSRMGENKALLAVNGETVIERLVRELQSVTNDILIVTNTPEDYHFLPVKKVSDRYPNKGPLAGIESGLYHSTNDKNIIVACDMPFVAAETMEWLLSHLEGYSAVIPEVNGQIHPLLAVYHKRVREIVEKCLEANDLKLQIFLNQLKVKKVTEEDMTRHRLVNFEQSFFNMNDPSDWRKAIQISSKN